MVNMTVSLFIFIFISENNYFKMKRKLLSQIIILLQICLFGCDSTSLDKLNNSNSIKFDELSESEKIQSIEYSLSINDNLTKVIKDEDGVLKINLNHQDLNRFKKNEIVYYSDLGAAGDGISDDMIFIVATHILANQYGFNVKADDGAKYLIGGRELTAIIETNTDFGSATFIIDDTDVENRFASVFEVKSK